MRQLTTNDIFRMSRIVNKIGIKIDLESIDIDDENWDEKFGIEILNKIIQNAHLVQTEINEFIGSLVNMSGEEFGNLPLKESIGIVKQMKELSGLSDFFKSAEQIEKPTL